jgi:hypothetical protein
MRLFIAEKPCVGRAFRERWQRGIGIAMCHRDLDAGELRTGLGVKADLRVRGPGLLGDMTPPRAGIVAQSSKCKAIDNKMVLSKI